MRESWYARVAGALAAAGCLTAFASAGVIRVQVGAGTPIDFPGGQPITVNVGTLSGTTPLLVRVFDPGLINGLPDDDAGKITIIGDTTGGGEMRVLVAGLTDAWPELADSQLLSVGVRNLGTPTSNGIVFQDSLGNPSPVLAGRTRLAAYTSGNIRGSITVGQVQRIQCGNLNAAAASGTISADITATATDTTSPAA